MDANHNRGHVRSSPDWVGISDSVVPKHDWQYHGMNSQHQRGFTLVEILVVVAIIATLSVIAIVATGGIGADSRDTKRKTELSQFGRLISLSCYMPESGAGDYDLTAIVDDFKQKNPRYAETIGRTPRDPVTGTDQESGYRYVVSPDGKNCAFYVNLENEEEEITLERLDEPKPGGGTGTFRASEAGPNGTQIYFQVSN